MASGMLTIILYCRAMSKPLCIEVMKVLTIICNDFFIPLTFIAVFTRLFHEFRNLCPS